MSPIVIHIQPAAPTKPAPGAACNGCGVCCLTEPCPVGMLVSRKRHGACTALVWNETEARYRCGLLSHVKTEEAGTWARWRQRLALRFISAGSGCDCTLEVTPNPAG